MRLLQFERKNQRTSFFILERALSSWIPAVLMFVCGYYKTYWLIIPIMMLIAFEISILDSYVKLKY